MKDEIKEIEKILATSGKYITYAERCYVLDYITNLQYIIDKANNILKDTSIDMPETLLIETIDYARHILNGGDE